MSTDSSANGCFGKENTQEVLPVLPLMAARLFDYTIFRDSPKVIYTKYSKHRPYTVAHKIDCVCRKWFKSWVFPFTFQAYILPHTLNCICVLDAVGSLQIFFPTQNLERAY